VFGKEFSGGFFGVPLFVQTLFQGSIFICFAGRDGKPTYVGKQNQTLNFRGRKMMFVKKKLILLLALFTAILLALTGCGPKDNGDVHGGEYTGEDDFVVIECPEKGEVEISVAELMTLKAIEQEIQKLGDNGEVEDQYPIKGVLLEDVLAHLEISADNLDSLRFTAGDGYSVEVPKDILTSAKVILAYEIDGEPLFEGTRPIRMFIPGQEAMYWVKNTVKISLSRGASDTPGPGGDQAGPLKKIVFFETLQSLVEVVDYAGEAGAKAVKNSQILADVQTSSLVRLLASDGFEKNEELDTFLANYIVVQGENAPAFRGPDLPRGMHVKNLVFLSTGDTGFLFVEKGKEYFETASVGEDNGIKLKDLVDKLGLEKADAYILESEDGYSVEVSFADLEKGIVFLRDDGILSSAFQDLPKNTKVKYLLSISVVQ
jgi:hypothetical protein